MQFLTPSGIAPLAQWHPGPYGPHWGGAGTGMGGMGMGTGLGGGWVLALLLAVLLLAAVAAVLLYATRTVATGGADGDRALDTLRERYAAGEVDDEEFERRMTRLQKTG